MTKYNDYTARVSHDPSYYGSNCAPENARRIVQNLADLIQTEFPGIQVEGYRDGLSSGSTIGPDQDTADTIDNWISENWTKSL